MQRFLTKASFETGNGALIIICTYFDSKTTALLHLHRWFFIQAIREKPDNPFDHPFGYSVKTVLDSSYALIEALHDIYQYQPTFAACFRPSWTHAFSAAVRRDDLPTVYY